MGIYRAILISGPPGIGKTTSAHLMAKMAGYSPLELNASDTRSKKLVEVSWMIIFPSGRVPADIYKNSTNIDNASLDGFFAGTGIKVSSPSSRRECVLQLTPQSTTVADVKIGSKTCLIMDEIDGMSAGDRGGVGALNTLIKKTRVSCRSFSA